MSASLFFDGVRLWIALLSLAVFLTGCADPCAGDFRRASFCQSKG